MHNIEMLAVLQIAAGFARLDAYIYIWFHNKLLAWGMFMHWRNKLPAPPNAVQDTICHQS